MFADYRENFLSFSVGPKQLDPDYGTRQISIVLGQTKKRNRMNQDIFFIMGLYYQNHEAESVRKSRETLLLVNLCLPQMLLLIDVKNPDQVFAATSSYELSQVRYYFRNRPIELPIAVGRLHEETCSEFCYENSSKRFYASRNNVKMIFPSWKPKKVNPGYLWKFLLYYPHQKEITAQNIVVPRSHCVENATLRLGFHRNPNIDYSSGMSISDILLSEKRIYLKKRLFIIDQAVVVSNNEFLFMEILPNMERKIVRLFDPSMEGYDFSQASLENIVDWEEFIRQYISWDVFIIANVSKDGYEIDSEKDNYVGFYFPRSPEKTGEIFDSRNLGSKIGAYQTLHNMLSRMLKYGVMKYLNSRLKIDHIQSELKPGSKILSVENVKKPVFPEDNLLSCQIDFESYDMRHRRSFEIFIESKDRIYPVSVNVADLYNHIKTYHEELKEEPEISEYSDIFQKRIILRSLLATHSKITFFLKEDSTDSFVDNIGSVILTSWEGAAHYIIDHQANINNILRISLFQFEDLFFDLRETENIQLFDKLQSLTIHEIDVPIKDNIKFLYDSAFTKEQFTKFFISIQAAYKWIKYHPERVLIVHCRSGIGRGAIFTAILWYYAIGMQMFNSPQCLELDVGQKVQTPGAIPPLHFQEHAASKNLRQFSQKIPSFYQLYYRADIRKPFLSLIFSEIRLRYF